MQQPKKLSETPSQTAGPYVHIGCVHEYAGITGVYDRDLKEINAVEGNHLLEVSIFDGAGNRVTDAIIEVWGTDPAFWARCAYEDERDCYQLMFPKPERRVEEDNKIAAPHLSLFLAARGINVALNTRVYFPDENNEDDDVLNRVDKDRRATLLSEKFHSGYRFQIHLQGDQETVFFDI